MKNAREELKSLGVISILAAIPLQNRMLGQEGWEQTVLCYTSRNDANSSRFRNTEEIYGSSVKVNWLEFQFNLTAEKQEYSMSLEF